MKTIEELYQERIAHASCDIVEHLPTLRRYASLCETVVEFGTRGGYTTTAFLAAGATVYSYDVQPHGFPCPNDALARWSFHQEDTQTLATIPACDFLFIDAKHTAANVAQELTYHPHVRRWIGLHDHIEWGTRGEDGHLGINGAIFPFLAEQKLLWRVCEARNNCRGLLVLERIP